MKLSNDGQASKMKLTVVDTFYIHYSLLFTYQHSAKFLSSSMKEKHTAGLVVEKLSLY